jgi:hypothetical protein
MARKIKKLNANKKIGYRPILFIMNPKGYATIIIMTCDNTMQLAIQMKSFSGFIFALILIGAKSSLDLLVVQR